MFQQPPAAYEESKDFSSNDLTLSSYERAWQEYIAGTPAEISPGFKAWIDQTLALLPLNAQIIEIGSGFGRDAAYIESFGFRVERTDATESFVAFLQKQGFAAHSFNILTDVFSSQYDLIFANAVFLHFTPEELKGTLQKVAASLKKEGILSFSVKKGEGEEWSNAKLGVPCYFCYWTKEKLVPLLEQAELEAIHFSEDDRFLQIIAKRKS